MSSPESESSSTSGYKSLSPSNDTTEFQSEKLPTSPQSTINHQLPVNQQDGTKVITTPGAEIVTTSSNPSESPRNKQPGSDSEKPHGLPQNNDQQGLPTKPENSINGSSLNDLGGLQKMFDQIYPNKPTGEPQPESVTTPQPPSYDQECMTKNPTIGPPNLTMSNEQPETLLISTTDYLREQSSQPTENIPDEQPQRHQQQTIPNQQTTTQENLNVEPSSNNPSASKPSVTLRKVIEQTEITKEKMLKKTPIPLPRKNKPGTNERRKNAANFSTPSMKVSQTKQEHPVPTELNNDGVKIATKSSEESEQENPLPTKPQNSLAKDEVTAVTGPNEKNEQNPTTQKLSATTDKSKENSLYDELD